MTTTSETICNAPKPTNLSTFAAMENWQIDFEWIRVQHIVKNSLRRDTPPDLNMVLLLIGIQELGQWKKGWTKEEKQDLMHVGVCTLLLQEGFFEFVGRDSDGWPHFRQVREMDKSNLMQQEIFLKKLAIQYFKDMEKDNGGWGELAEG